MKRRLNQAEATYGPQQHKNFAGALGAFFAQECPQLGGHRTRQVLVQAVTNLVHQFYPETTHLRQGQIQWTTVDRDEKASYGKTIQDTKLTSVVLDLVCPEDAGQRAQRKRLRELKKKAVVRLFQQAWHQGGCLTNAEVGTLLKICDTTVSKYVREYENEHQCLLPRRGTMHDMGPTITHKVQIVRKLFLEGKTVQQTMRETSHSARAVHRYIQAFKQVLLCHRRGLSVGEIAYATKMTGRLVEEYLQLLQNLAKENFALDQLLKSLETEARI
jgi:hypothetical protein